MKNFKKLIAIFVLLLSFNSLSAQKVVGYMDVNLSEAQTRMNQMNWAHMSDFIYGFITPNTSGVLPDPTTLKLFNEIKQKCIDNGVELHFSSGGASNSGMFHTIGQNPTATAKFAEEIADVMAAQGMKGWDLDWEFPRSAAEQVSQVNILKAVHDEFTARGKRDEWKIAIAVGGETPSVGAQGVYHTGYCSAGAFQYIDYLNIMSYDIGYNISGDDNHSSYADAVNNVNDWVAKGCPIEKIVLGVPFYARHKTTRGLPPGSFYDITYGNMSNADPATYYNQNYKGDYFYNGAPLLKQKTDYIMNAGGVGIMVWEVTYDRFDQYSLLKALHDAMEPYRCSAPMPDLGSDVSICGLNSITLDGGVSQQSGVTFTWKDETQTLVNQSSSANTFNALSAGVYTLEVWENGCNRSDQIEVTGVLNTPDLGGPYELCDPVSVSLDAGVSGNGRTIQWELNNQVINGASNSVFEAKKGGTYKVTVSANGCSPVNASAVVTSEVPFADPDTVCMAGDEADLEASETVKWFSSENAVSEIITDQVFSPVVNTNSTYWMGGAGSALTQYSTLGTTVGSSWGAGTANYGRKITIISELTIDAVSVEAVAGGSVKINLKGSDGTTIVKTTTATIGSGNQEVTLDWTDIAPGDYYLDAVGSSINLMIGSNAGSDFDLPGIFFSEGHGYANWGSGYGATTDYSFFFGLKLTAGKECARVPVNVVIDPNNNYCLTVASEDVVLNKINVYPNPSNSEFTISNGNGELTVFDVKGSIIQTSTLNGNVVKIGADLEKGVYFIQLNSNGNISTEKIIKK